MPDAKCKTIPVKVTAVSLKYPLSSKPTPGIDAACIYTLYETLVVNNAALGLVQQVWKDPKRFATCAPGKPPHKSYLFRTSDTRTLCTCNTLFVWA